MKRHMAPWTQMVVAVAALASLAGGGLAVGVSVHVKATLSDTERRLALLERQDETLQEELTTEKSYRKSVLAKLDALCRAMPQANCPLGENER